MAKTKGIIVELGGDATGLNKAISSVSREARGTQSELKKIERLLKMDPGNVTLLKQKQDLLNESISRTEGFVTALKKAKEKADADMANGTEINEKEYRELERQIFANERKLLSLKEQAEAVNSSLVNIDGDSFVILEKKAKSAADVLEEAFNSGTKEIGDLKKELKEVNKLLETDPHNIDFLEQQFEILQETVWETEKKLKSLNEVQEKINSGEIDLGEKEYRKLARQIAETEAELRRTSESARLVSKTINDIQDGSLIDVEKSADQAADALEDAAKEAADFGDVLKANLISDAASGIVDSLKDVAEETKEYRKIMGSLEVSSEAAGYTAEQTSEAYRRLYGVLADDQSAATTLANLQALELSQDNLLALIDNVIGGWAKYGDSIPIDGLAEAVNETIRAGQVTGTFADIINWGARECETYGVKMREATEANEEWNESVAAAETAEDFFNLALQECSTEAERANLVMQAMADQGLGAMAEKWKENNAAMVESNEANAALQEQMAQLGETIEPLMTMINGAIAEILAWFNGLDEGTQNFIIGAVAMTAVLVPLIAFFAEFGGKIMYVISLLASWPSQISSIVGFIISNPLALAIAAIVGFVALIVAFGDQIQSVLEVLRSYMTDVFAMDWTEILGPVLGEAMNGFWRNIGSIVTAVTDLFIGLIDFIRGVFTGDWERAWTGVKNIFGAIFDGLYALAVAPINAIIGLINAVIEGLNFISIGINKVNGIDAPGIGKIPMLADGGTVWSGSAIVGEAGPELLTVTGGKAVVQPLTANTGKIEGLLGDISSQLGGGGYDIPIVVQVTVDGKVLGETATEYIRRQDRAYGK